MEYPVTIFCNSIGFCKDAEPCFENTFVDKLIEDKSIVANSVWYPGMTILDVFNLLKTEQKYWFSILIGVGATEAVSRPSNEVLKMIVAYLSKYGTDQCFYRYLLDKMIEATDNPEGYCSFLDLPAYKDIYFNLAEKLMDGKGVFLGFCKPNPPQGKERWIEQTEVFNAVVKEAAERGKHHFVDVWNITDGHVYDSTHLTEQGHFILYEEIKKVLRRMG